MCYFSSVIQLNVCKTEYGQYLRDLFTSYLTEDSRKTSIRHADWNDLVMDQFCEHYSMSFDIIFVIFCLFRFDEMDEM